MEVQAAVLCFLFSGYLYFKKDKAIACLVLFSFFLTGFSASFEQVRSAAKHPFEGKSISGRVVRVSKSGIKLMTRQGEVFLKFNDYQKFLYLASNSFSFCEIQELRRSGKFSGKENILERFLEFKELVRFRQINVRAEAIGRKGTIYGRFDIGEKQQKKDFADLLATLRVELKHRLEKWLRVYHASLIYGLLTGDRSDTDPLVSFSLCSLAAGHILAISGLHVGMIYYVVRKLFSGFFGFSEGFLSVAAFAVLALYLLVVGFPESGLRAIFMALSFEVARILKRRIDLNDSLLFSVLLTTILKPSSVSSPGFQFSAASVLGISCVFPVLKRFSLSERKQSSRLKEMILLTLSVQLLTAPLQLYYFKTLTLFGSVLNLYAVPAVPVLMACGLLLVAFDFLGLEILCQAVACIIAVCANLLFFFSSVLSYVPGAYLNVSRDREEVLLQLIQICSYLFVFLVARKVVFEGRNAKVYALLLIAAFLSVATMNLFVFAVFFDCGHGNSFAVNGALGSLLFDAGPPGFSAFERFMNLKIQPPSAVFLSHYHLDHIGGLLDLIAGFRFVPVKPTIYLPEPGCVDEKLLAEMFIAAAKKNGYRTGFTKKGRCSIGGIVVEVFGKDDARNSSDKNERCNMYAIEVRKFLSKSSIFYPADSPRSEFEDIDANRFDVVVASHHGSLTGFSPDFYCRFKGRVIIQCGRNKFGLPAREVLDFLNSRGIDHSITSKEGLVLVSGFF